MVEKLKIDKDITVSEKESLINEIISIVTSYLEELDIHTGDYMINMIEDEVTRFIVNKPNYDKCGAISLNFKKATKERIERGRQSFNTFLNNLKRVLERKLINFENVKVNVVDNIANQHLKKIHIVL